MEGELSDDLLDLPLSELGREDEELDLGAETGMITPVFLNPARENFGAERLAEKSKSGETAEERADGVDGFASAHKPEGVFLTCGRRLSGESGGEGGGVITPASLEGCGRFDPEPYDSKTDLGLNALRSSRLICAGGGLGPRAS